MQISIVTACDANGLIGVNGKLPWHLPEDLRRFKELTVGKTVIMGRKTFESIGRKPLPERDNIVVTRSINRDLYITPGTNSGYYPCPDLEEALLCAKYSEQEEVFIIGGVELYREALKIADTLYLTLVSKKRDIRPEDTDVRYFPADILKLSNYTTNVQLGEDGAYLTINLEAYRAAASKLA